MKIRTKATLLNILLVTAAIAITVIFSLIQIHADATAQAKEVQESHLRTFWELLRAKGDTFSIKDGKLMVGDYPLNGNNELPDKIKELFGGTATIFMGDKRVSTNVVTAEGARAVGTVLEGAPHVALFSEGKPYRGEADILGIPYFTAYDPIRNARGEVIGAVYVGIKKNDYFAGYEKIMHGSILIALLVGGAFGLISIFLVRRLMLPLGAMVDKLREVSNHEKEVTDLTIRLEQQAHDEIGLVAGEFNALLEKMQQIISLVTNITREINSCAGTVSSSVHHQASFTSQLSSSVSEISSTMEEFTSTAAEIARHTQGVVETAETTLHDTREGAVKVETLTDKMAEISRDNQDGIREIVDLGRKSKEITKIMGIINTIANQTKLIAFNAALEAASAGEAGKRFGVVALEIRRLADNVFESTDEIEGKITEILDTVNRLVIASEKSSKGIQDGLEYSTHTTAILNDLVSGAESTTEAARQISLSTQQQQTASSQVVIALRDIEEGVRFSSSSIQQTSEVSRNLTEMAATLRKLVGTFTLVEGSGTAPAANSASAVETLEEVPCL
ncbi:MAG: methyl-accepting chemotaxis protein [Geobacteraceae bacterium]|nr:methyl-accepting chemotaxis protein [Geobacteraceae bacterium]